MNDLTQYLAVRPQIHAGDIVVFWGRGPLSWAIELMDDGPSHSAIVRQPLTDQGEDAMIIQSTIQTWDGKKVNGVQTEPLGQTIAGYGPGSAAVLLLDDATRAKIDWFQFYQMCGASDGFVTYDIADLFQFLAREFPIFGHWVFQGETPRKLVCSAWVVALLESCGVLTGIDYAEATPQALVEMKIFKGWLPLLGEPKLTRFDTI